MLLLETFSLLDWFRPHRPTGPSHHQIDEDDQKQKWENHQKQFVQSFLLFMIRRPRSVSAWKEAMNAARDGDSLEGSAPHTHHRQSDILMKAQQRDEAAVGGAV